MKIKHVYINTIGCQMNVYDSGRIVSGLEGAGYIETTTIENADLIIINTCSIREKAEQKAFSFLGRLSALKKKKPGLIIGVGGCVAQQEGKALLKRIPFVDIVFGTRAIHRLAEHIVQIEGTRKRIVDIEMPQDAASSAQLYNKPYHENGSVSGFVTIMRGCDNFCTYCVVPHVRGREASRSPENIIHEIESLVLSGLREVTLLGQNVNSYGKKEALPSFPELLSRVNDIDGLQRIRFTTSHPKDLSASLINAFGQLEKLCDHIHLPVQSGSNPVLKRMNRKYTREQYLEKVATLQRTCPGIAITSDIIVGFPGETRDDFNKTLDLIKTIEFDGLFAFAYSDRPNASSSYFDGKIDDSEKKERLQELLDLQEYYTRKKNQALVGSTQRILVEGTSKKQASREAKGTPHAFQWTGRTTTNKIVNFLQNDSDNTFHGLQAGDTIDIKIEKAFSHSLWGIPILRTPPSIGKKGENCYAA